ncbi:hypothetical protein SAMIE_1024720 [Sphingobium amiense]|uniref:Uncharacterized protein n=2 Tax=Sphingobium amiense TaxID=135719 RepID=A0A494W433_9SPHN|nr:hypothetical protein [Sphingobium amiense]BBD98971.1 hypothetical protein SAMIE_1024720 [Sphingobium amiense]
MGGHLRHRTVNVMYPLRSLAVQRILCLGWTVMGSLIRPLLIAAPLLLAAPALAQQGEQTAPVFSLPPAGSASPPDSNRQGPEINIYRDPPAQNAAPPTVTPTVVPPPVAVQPAPASPRPKAQRERPAPPPAEGTPERTAAPDPARQPAAESLPPPPVAATPDPASAPEADDALAGREAAAAQGEASPLPWVVGLLIAGAAGIAVFMLARRRRAPVALVAEPVIEAPIETARTPPAPRPPRPAPPPPEPVAPDPARPWIGMDLSITQARFSLMGVTIAYSLHLTNNGAATAQDMLVRGVIGNAGAQQDALLQGFLAGQVGLPLHSVVGIAPGETLTLTGELRLGSAQIEPVTVGERSLLVPLAAFDSAYGWEAGQGRTVRAFVIGQEQEPPADRLAPLRLDRGPRQYRRPAARAAAELTPT